MRQQAGDGEDEGKGISFLHRELYEAKKKLTERAKRVRKLAALWVNDLDLSIGIFANFMHQ